MVALIENPESWLVIALILAVFFGAKRLPEIARSIGRSKAEFQKGLQEGANEEREERPAGEQKPDQT